MKPMRHRVITTAALLFMILTAAIAYQAYAIATKAGQPTAVVTVNLGQVMEKLDQWSESAARLRKLKDELTAEQDKRTKAMETMKEAGTKLQGQIDAATDPKAKQTLEAQMQKMQEDAALTALDYQAWAAFSTEKADIEAALATQDLYRSIKTAVAQMAKSNLYDMVFVDDSMGELVITADGRVPRVQQVQQQIASRRTLYVNPAIDITDDLIQRMNNAYKQAGAKAP